jgi:hypothetical protein
MTIEVQVPRWKEFLSKVFAARGGRGGALAVLDDVLPVAAIYDPSALEFHFPRGERVWAIGQQSLSGAGVGPTVRLINPAGSQNLVCVESISVSGTSAAMIVAVGVGAAGAIGATTVGNTDTRGAIAQAIPTADYNAIAPLVLPQYIAHSLPIACNPTDMLGSDAVVILAPGWELKLTGSALLGSFYSTVVGYTRPMDLSEVL